MAASTATATAADTSCGAWTSDGSAGAGSDEGSAPIRGRCQPATPARAVAATTPSSEAGTDRWSRGSPTISAGHHAHHHQRLPGGGLGPSPHGVEGHHRGARAPWPGDAQRRRHLLQKDDHGDADREALHHRPGHVGDGPAQPADPGRQHQDTGHQPHRVDRAGPVPGDHRQQHHGHGPGGSGDLEIGAPEDPRHQAGHDGGGEADRGAQAGGDGEGEGQGQRHHADRDPRHHVAPPGRPEAAVVGPAGEEALERAPGPGRRGTGAGRARGAGAHASPVACRPERRSRVWLREPSSRRRATAISSTSSGSRMA